MSADRYVVHWYRGRYEGITGPFTPTTAMKIRREWARKSGRVGKVVVASSHDEAFKKTIDWKENPMRVVWKSNRYILDVVVTGDMHVAVKGPGGHLRNFSDERSAVSFAKKVEEGMNHGLPAEQAWQYAKTKALQSNPMLRWVDRGYDHGVHLWETTNTPATRWQITTRVKQRPQSYTLYPARGFGRSMSFPTLEAAKSYASTLIGENPLSGTMQASLITLGIVGAIGLGYLFLSKPAAASTTGSTGGEAPTPPLLNVYSGTSGATYHVAVGQPIQFNLPTPDSGYTWIDSQSGDSVLGGEIINTIVSAGWQEVATAEQTGTQTITWTQQDSNGNPNPSGATYSYTIVAS